MTLKKITLSALTAAMVTGTAMAGTLTYTGTNTTYVVASEMYLGTGDVNNSMDANNTLTYKTGAVPSGTVTEPAITLEFPTGVKAWLTPADANISIGIVPIGIIKSSSNGTNQLIFDKVSGSSLNSNTDLNITGLLTVQFPDGTTSTSATLKIGYSTSPDTADQGTVSLITEKDQVTASVSTKFAGFIDAANQFKLLVNSAGGNLTPDVLIITLKSDNTGIDNAVVSAGTSFSTVLNVDNNVSLVGVMGANQVAGTATTVAITQGADNNYTSGLTAITIDATDETLKYDFVPTGVNGTNQFSTSTFTVTATGTYAAGTETLMTSSAAGSWTIYGYSAQIPNVVANASIDTTLKFTNSSTTASEVYFTLIDPDGTTASLDSVSNGLAKLGVNVTGTYKASELFALISDTNFDKTGSVSVEVSIPTTPNNVYGFASFKNNTLGQFKDLPVYNSSTNSY